MFFVFSSWYNLNLVGFTIWKHSCYFQKAKISHAAHSSAPLNFKDIVTCLLREAKQRFQQVSPSSVVIYPYVCQSCWVRRLPHFMKFSMVFHPCGRTTVRKSLGKNTSVSKAVSGEVSGYQPSKSSSQTH